MEKLFWKVKHKTNFNKESDFLEVILKENGVKDIDRFLNVKYKDTFDPMLFKDMDKAIALFHSIIEKDNVNVFVKIDSDVDGFTSGVYIMGLIKALNPKINVAYKISPDKEHGIFYNDIDEFEKLGTTFDLIIVPDAGSENIIDCNKIYTEKKTPILILDHHEYKDESIRDCAVLINCTDGVYPNTDISGVGVVHKFALAYCYQFKIDEDILNDFLQLVALGNVADSINLKSLETRYYVLEGLKEEHRHNDFLKELCEHEAESMKLGHTIKNYGWVVAPNINAMVRYGSSEEQSNTIRAMLGEKETIEYQPRRKKASDPKPETEFHSLQKTMARLCSNAKARQDNEVKRFMEKLSEKIKSEQLDKNSVIIIDGTDILSKNTVTGLVANKIASMFKRPAIIFKSSDKETFGGSGRGYGRGKIDNFNKFLTASGLIECKGHPNAFGVSISKSKTADLINYCNKEISAEDLVTVHEVDYEIEASSLKYENVLKLATSYSVWGNGVDEPTFAITNILIPAKDIIGFAKGDSDYIGFIKFKINGIDFIRKYCNKSDYADMTLKERTGFGANKKLLNMTVIASFGLEEWEGDMFPQIIIKSFYSVEDDGKQSIISDIEGWTENSGVKPNKDSCKVTNNDLDDFIF